MAWRANIPWAPEAKIYQETKFLSSEGYLFNFSWLLPDLSFFTECWPRKICLLKRLPRFVKAAKYEIQKPSTCRATLFRCKFSSMFPVFHLAWSTWPATKTFVAKSIARTRGSTLSNRFWLCCSFFIKLTTFRATNLLRRALANQPISAPHLFSPQQMFLLRVKLIVPGEKRETTTKTCNETMLRDKLRVFVSRISPPLGISKTAVSVLSQK